MARLDVTPGQWLAVGVFVLLAVLASTQVGSIWRGEARQWPMWWTRGLPAAIGVGWLMIAALPVEVFVMSRPEPVSAWLVLLFAFMLVLVAVGILVAAAVALTGHPRRLVPPYLRND